MSRILVIDVEDGSVNLIICPKSFATVALERLASNWCIGRILADSETHQKITGHVILF